MADQDKRAPSYSKMIELLKTKVGCYLSIFDSSQIPVYSEYEKMDFSTLIGRIKPPTTVKVAGYVEKGGNAIIKVYIPKDSNNNWSNGFYGYITIGPNTGNVNNHHVYLRDDNETNKRYLNGVTVSNYNVPQSNISYFVSEDNKVNTSVIENIDNWSKGVSNVNKLSEFQMDNKTIEQYWIDSPTVSADDYAKSIDSFVDLSKLRMIFGLPYQFLSTTDMRLNTDIDNEDGVFGYTYAEKIGSRMPLLYLTPGNPKFLSDSTSSERKSAISSIIDKYHSGDSNLNDLLDEYSGKLYSIEPAYNEYFGYVNPMCRTGAVLLGLDTLGNDATRQITGDNDTAEARAYRQLDGVWCSVYNWAFADNSDQDKSFTGGDGTNTKFENPVEFASEAMSWLYYKQVIPFYITSEPTFSDNFSNETTESQLASKVNGFSDSAREMQFLLGTTSSVIAENWDALGDVFANSRKAIEDFTTKLSGNGGIFSSLIGNLKTVASGGRLMFPNIWSNSSYNKSYNINIKLTTPYYDVKSWWLNIYVPLCHLIALVFPRGEFHNGYSAPFLVKAFIKGSFNIDMGIITEMTINKGKEGGWTKDGLPTVVDVSFTIQDLYSSISMSPITLMKSDTLENIQELDYLCSLCGININEPDISRVVKMYTTLKIQSKFIDIPFNLFSNATQSISNKITSLFSMMS